jgi:hypothetical protein
LSADEANLPATSGPGIQLPEVEHHSSDDSRAVPWWDTAIAEPGEPQLDQIGISGAPGYGIIANLRLAMRLNQRFGARRVQLIGVGAIAAVVVLLILLAR